MTFINACWGKNEFWRLCFSRYCINLFPQTLLKLWFLNLSPVKSYLKDVSLKWQDKLPCIPMLEWGKGAESGRSYKIVPEFYGKKQSILTSVKIGSISIIQTIAQTESWWCFKPWLTVWSCCQGRCVSNSRRFRIWSSVLWIAGTVRSLYFSNDVF